MTAAVTLQPGWADLVVNGIPGRTRRRYKSVELRTWTPSPNLTGHVIAIGASAKISPEGRLPLELYGLDGAGLAKGRVVGLVRLVSVRPATLADAEASMLPRELLVEAGNAARAKGRTLLAWELAEPQPLADDPRLACKGAVGRMVDVDLGFLLR